MDSIDASDDVDDVDNNPVNQEKIWFNKVLCFYVYEYESAYPKNSQISMSGKNMPDIIPISNIPYAKYATMIAKNLDKNFEFLLCISEKIFITITFMLISTNARNKIMPIHP